MAPKIDIFSVIQFVQFGTIVGLYFAFTRYGPANAAANIGLNNSVGSYYSFFTDVAVMIFVGFGYLMTFLRRYRFSAVGYTFYLSSFVVMWSILVVGFFEKLHSGHWDDKIDITIVMLIEGMFASGACMISLGAWLGKISPPQLVIIFTFEVVFYALNFYIGALELKAVDMGGSMFVHSFGAYFGLAASMFLSRPTDKYEKESAKNESDYNSDLFAMIGTIFLFILWPSFNGALAPESSQFRVVINTVLALCASCYLAFISSKIFRHDHRFNMVDVQNATLAGGVAVGSSSDLTVSPGGALVIGSLAGLISVLGYVYVSPWLEKKLGIRDTCGVHNLHGIPGVFGGLTGAFTTALSANDREWQDVFEHGSDQWYHQLLALIITLAISLSSGAVVGLIVSKLPAAIVGKPDHFFTEDEYWEVPADYEEDEDEGGRAKSQSNASNNKAKFEMELDAMNN